MHNKNYFEEAVVRKILRFEKRILFLQRQIRSIQDDITILKANPQIYDGLKLSHKAKIQQLEMFGT